MYKQLKDIIKRIEIRGLKIFKNILPNDIANIAEQIIACDSAILR
jgi:hypothetical protein